MIFILPFVFGAIGVAVGAVAGAFTAHAAGEKDRQGAKHHRQVANELTDKYASLEKKYYEFADESKKQINDLTRQNALSEIEKDCLRLAVRLQQNVIYLMWEIDREPTADALNRFQAAVEQTNQVLEQLKEELIIVPDDYYARLLKAITATKTINTIKSKNVNSKTIRSVLSVDLGRTSTKSCVSREPSNVVFIPANVKGMTIEQLRGGVFEPRAIDPLMDLWLEYQGSGYAVGHLAADFGANLGVGQSKVEDALVKVLASAGYFKLKDEISVVLSLPFFSLEQFAKEKAQLISLLLGNHKLFFRGESVNLNISKVWVMPQGYGSLLWCQAQPKKGAVMPDFKKVFLAIVDIGHETIDCLIVDNFRFIRDASKSEDFGMNKFYELVAAEIDGADSQSLALICAVHKPKGERFYLPKGASKSTNLDDFLPNLIEIFSREILSRISTWFPPVVTDVIITGGGGEFFWEDVQRFLKEAKINAHLAIPSRQANALGQFIYGEAAFSKTRDIKVIGIGWGGINAVNQMIKANIGVDFWAIDADIKMLAQRAAAPNSLQIGSGLNRPLNLSDIAWGEMVANESRDDIAGVLDKTELVFIVASIGDDTAVGAASIIAEVAKEMGVITIGVVNDSYFANQIEPFKKRVDALIAIPSYTYDMSCQAVQSISNLITIPGLLNPDFADLCTVMTYEGAALIGIGASSGKSRVSKAVKAAISSPFLESSLEEAQGIAFHISGNSNLTLQEVNVAVKTIDKVVSPKAKIVFGATIDDTLQDEIRITIIATGLQYLGIFQKLRNLLAQGKWEEADNETANLMFQLSGQKYAMSSEYSKTVPFTEFNTIDKLWNEYSNGHFGFSVQKRIWQEEYSKLGEFDTNKIYARFCETVGWRVMNGCLLSSYLNFSLNAPVGHLPVKVAGEGWSAASFLGSIYKSEQEELDTLGIYENLKNLLEDEKWQEANEETRIVMLKIVGRTQKDFFQEEDIEQFPNSDLETIDRLWRTYSYDRFGFSVQKHVWQNVKEHWHEFGDSVGWGYYDEWDNFQWISKEEIIFKLYAPEGHLPAVFPCVTQSRGFSARLVWSLLSKFFAPEEADLLKRVENIGIYQRLKRLLAAGKWRGANHETRRVMLKLNGRIKEGDFTKGYEEDCRYLYIIDRLWVIYSKGRFGFSVQEKIWQEVHKDFQEFGTCVGWGFKRRKDYFWVSYHKLNFTLDAPEGHLPAVFPLLNQYRGFDEQNVLSILSKIEFI